MFADGFLKGQAQTETVFTALIEFAPHTNLTGAFQEWCGVAKYRWETYKMLAKSGLKNAPRDHSIELDFVSDSFQLAKLDSMQKCPPRWARSPRFVPVYELFPVTDKREIWQRYADANVKVQMETLQHGSPWLGSKHLWRCSPPWKELDNTTGTVALITCILHQGFSMCNSLSSSPHQNHSRAIFQGDTFIKSSNWVKACFLLQRVIPHLPVSLRRFCSDMSYKSVCICK